MKVSADVSSQFVSGLLLAGFDVEVDGPVVSAPYIEMTKRVRDTFGPTFAVEPDATAAHFTTGGQESNLTAVVAALCTALAIGGPTAWKDKLVTRLERKNAA